MLAYQPCFNAPCFALVAKVGFVPKKVRHGDRKRQSGTFRWMSHKLGGWFFSGNKTLCASIRESGSVQRCRRPAPRRIGGLECAAHTHPDPARAQGCPRHDSRETRRVLDALVRLFGRCSRSSRSLCRPDARLFVLRWRKEIRFTFCPSSVTTSRAAFQQLQELFEVAWKNVSGQRPPPD